MWLFLELFLLCKHSCWYFLLAVQVVSYGSYTILVHLCEENGQISFNSTAMNFLIETFKLVISVLLLFTTNAAQWYKARRTNQRQRWESHDSEASRNLRKDATENESESSSSSDSNISSSPNFSKFPQKFTRTGPGGRTTKTDAHSSPFVRHLSRSLNFSIPAFLYVINNNLAVYIQLYMDSTSYQMLSNLKIFTTALLYYLIIGKKLSKVKCLALLLLFVAGVFYSIANLKSISNYYIDESDLKELIKPDNVENSDYNARFSERNKLPNQPAKFRLRDQIYITEIGFMLMLIYCLISGFSGVYNEYLFKLNFTDSIYVQNIYLYTYGCFFNLIAYYIETTYIRTAPVMPATTPSANAKSSLLSAMPSSSHLLAFFDGFSVFTWLIILTQVFNGFLMSIVMKHASNITRLFVISSSLVVTTVLSVLIFSLQLNIFFYIVFCAIVIALYLYSAPETSK